VSDSDAPKFVVGEYIEYCPMTINSGGSNFGCDGVVREITAKSPAPAGGTLVAFTPAISGYVAPTCGGGDLACTIGIQLWGTNRNFSLDMRMKSDSPARDARTTIASFSEDRNGVSRPQGSAWDIGPYDGEACDLYEIVGGLLAVPLAAEATV
jgi:hypothetical protein